MSKWIWFLAGPTSLIVWFCLIGLALQLTPWRRFGARMIMIVAALLIAIATFPLTGLVLKPLEDRFPPPAALPEHVDGIIQVGGAATLALSESRGQPVLNNAAERIFAFVELARRYPAARLAVSGGSGYLWPGKLRESDVMRDVFRQIGFDTSRVSFEDRSRNTYENAKFGFEQLKPEPGETWILITSASHMPRAVGSFRKAGWTVIPYPVDYHTPAKIGFGCCVGLVVGIADLYYFSHEWIGLTFYRLLGRTDAWFPGPEAAG